MKIVSSLRSVLQAEADLLVLVCFEEQFLKDSVLDVLDRKLDGWLKKTIQNEQFLAKKNQQLMLPTYGKLGVKKLLLLGAGSLEHMHPADFRLIAARATKISATATVEKLAMVVVQKKQWIQPVSMQYFIEGFWLTNYRFDKYISSEKKRNHVVKQVEMIFAKEHYKEIPAEFKDFSKRAEIISTAVMHARDYSNEPAGVMTPEKLANEAKEIAKKSNRLKIQILDEKECKKQGMGLLLAVGQGSDLPVRFVHLSYSPPSRKGKRTKKVALIGKGITFDSGGVAIKTPQGMMDMKADMSGAGTVIAAMEAIEKLGSPYEVHAFIPCAENMVSGRSYRLRDIIISMSGKTVEITNTDAEGRLILADAITYALQKEKPDEIIDIATLTGAVVVALGPYMAGVMGNEQTLIDKVLSSARAVGEDAWPLPIPEFTNEVLKSDVADMKNAGDRNGGALTAARFIKEFVGETPWVHLDVAGPAFLEKEWNFTSKGATGFGVATLVHYLTS